MIIDLMRQRAFGAALVIAVLACSVSGCASTPYRPYVKATAPDIGCRAAAVEASPAGQTTPEVSVNPPYTLHYLEFDDQGWAYPNPTQDDPNQHWSPGYQIDCAIADLAHKVSYGTVRSFVYVHGWHHSADDEDRDVRRFRKFLKDQAHASSASGDQVLGFYIGWNGNTIDIPVLKDTTFWSRKNAAHHVSEGSVREFFSRVKALRNYWNRPSRAGSENCGKPQAVTAGHGCRLKTVMMGHSFGALVLFSATSPYILDTLASISDVPIDADSADAPVAARERGIADMVVLLNPAFEGSRYEAVHRAAQRYKHTRYETPLLVSVTSTADWATKNAFPVARFFNSIFQYPATTNAESQAMKRTHGHIDAYVTHELTVDLRRASTDENSHSECTEAAGTVSDRQTLRARFFAAATTTAGQLKLDARWEREMCGGLMLKSVGNEDLDAYSIIWNVRTFKDVMADHNDITGLPLRDFMEQLYGDLSRAPPLTLARSPVPEIATMQPAAPAAAVAARR